jgi:hypothetical protein
MRDAKVELAGGCPHVDSIYVSEVSYPRPLLNLLSRKCSISILKLQSGAGFETERPRGAVEVVQPQASFPYCK